MGPAETRYPARVATAPYPLLSSHPHRVASRRPTAGGEWRGEGREDGHSRLTSFLWLGSYRPLSSLTSPSHHSFPTFTRSDRREVTIGEMNE